MERELVDLFEAAKKAADLAAASDAVSEVSRCVDALKQLRAFPVSYDILVSTQVGKRLRSLSKHPREKIQTVASDLLELWKKVVIEETTKGKKNGTSSAIKSEKLPKPSAVKSEKLSNTENVKAEKVSKDNSVKSVKVEKREANGDVAMAKKSDRGEMGKVEKICKDDRQSPNVKKSSQPPAGPPKLTSMVKCNDLVRDKFREILGKTNKESTHCLLIHILFIKHTFRFVLVDQICRCSCIFRPLLFQILIMYGRDPWGGPLEINATDSATDDDRSRNLQDLDRAALSRPLDETQQSWLLGPGEQKKKKKYVDLGCIIVSRKIFVWTVGTLLVSALLAGLITLIVKTVPRHHHRHSPPDNYTLALHKALMFFNAQRSGKLPKHNNVSWRGNSGLQDGKSDPSVLMKDLVGGYYDAGDAIKFNFPASFSMTMLSWSVIEYSAKYEAAGELNHVKEIIKWGTDYLLKTFNNTADTIDRIAAQVGIGDTSGGSSAPNDHYCWMRPEDIDYPRPVYECHSCSDLAAEMAAALASASIVFKDNKAYSQKLVHGARTLFKFARDQRGRYSAGGSDPALFYNSSSYWDEFVWGGAWLYYATGNSSYLQLATHPKLAKHAGAFWGGPDYGVLSWDNKLAGAQVLLSRLRLFLSPGYPYEEILSTFHNQTSIIMCSFLPVFTSFNRTKGGLIQLNHGRPQPLQYVVNAAFLAALYSDYLDAADTPGWYCGPNFYSTDVLREFAKTQIDYILGKNPRKMSYVVGFGNHYPKHVHHRGASIPKNKIKYNCKGGWKWRDTSKPNPNTLVGAMVAGPDKHDGFRDVRTNYNYTEPTLAGNAGLVAALVALSGDKATGIDKNTIFSAVPPMFPTPPPPPAPWKP